MRKRRAPLLFAVAACGLLAGGTIGAADIPNDEASVRHALSRLTYGPRPGDVERIRETGLAAWIEQQLDPTRLPDTGLAARLPRSPASDISFASPQEARRAARAAIDDLAETRLIRAVYSDRQLEEVLVDFWFNHFNVFAGKGRTAIYLPEYERDAIRPHVLGRFRDLLGATAKHPAMLFYLDNWLSVDPEAANRPEGLRLPNGQAPPPAGRRRGLNENYARELLELHTLGVDGGYTQKDVVEVARAFTGWTIGPAGGRPRRILRSGGASQAKPGFRFARVLHDDDAKLVLGRTIEAGGGISDGERVLDIIAAHPSTARHIATKLARRFVSDEPPEALVSRAAARFRETDGDLREVVRTIVTSPEFFAAEARNAKVKTPLEFVVSVARATGDDTPNTRAMVRALRQLGMPLYMCQPPTGYDDTADTWITSGAIVARINIAQQLAGRRAEVVAAPEFQRR